MSTSPLTVGLGKLDSVTNSVTQAAYALSQTNGNDISQLWPVKSWGPPPRVIVAGVPKVEAKFHKAYEQGRMLESSLGEAISSIETKKLQVQETILHYLHLNRLTMTTKLPDLTRAPAAVKDSIVFLQQVQSYVADIQNMIAALQADIAMLLAYEQRMQSMIQTNLNALSVLLNEICNFDLPGLPSIPALLDMFKWSGFHFTYGFNFPALLAAFASRPFPTFQFPQCAINLPDLSALFSSPPNTCTVDGLTVTTAATTIPANGSTGITATTPTYIEQMQATTTPVFTPGVAASLPGSSLLNPAAVQSNYSLDPATYAANLPSVIPALSAVTIQTTDADYGKTPSVSRVLLYRSLLARYVNLQAIVDSNYDENLVAAWLIYLDLNRTGRSGSWLTLLAQVYTTFVTPSVSYVANTPVPWNTVLGGSGTSSAPTGIPLAALLQADKTDLLKWKLSFIEAALLGYDRNRTWDTAYDGSLTATDTGIDLDYVASTISSSTTALTLGAGSANYPATVSIPQSMGGVFGTMTNMATGSLADHPGYQSSRPQFRYVYDQFAQPKLVDSATQFWQELAANAATLVSGDSYLLGFVAHYPVILNAAVNPLADSTPYQTLKTDASSRSRTWTPGSVLPAIPTALAASASSTPPTLDTSGWSSGSFDAATYLARPDIQALPLPTQIAMLRTNQSYASLQNLSTQLSQSVSDTVAAAQTVIANAGLPGWQTETSGTTVIPAGVTLPVTFDTTDFDNTGYVAADHSIVIQSAGNYALAVSLNWDPSGDAGVRTVAVLVNGAVAATGNSDPTSTTPFVSQVSAIVALNLGDIVTVETSHALSHPETILAASTFLGFYDAS
jgi:hypothetical protein